MPGTSRWRWAGLCTNLLNYDRAWISDDFTVEPRDYLLYMGYLDGLSTMDMGLAPQASLAALPIRSDKPILFYGTSITCGQSVSRAGLTYSAQIGRALDRQIVNLGFPGNGKMELPTVRLIAEVDAAAFVIACVENMDAAQITERTEPLVHCLRAAHPLTPIILVESLIYENAWLVRAHQTRIKSSNDALRCAYVRCLAAGVPQVHYVSADRLLDPDQEGTVDGVHPNDIGSTTIAASLVNVLRPLVM
jgi:lysophospholipase L1-like esterase